jgi:hypothetical protein
VSPAPPHNRQVTLDGHQGWPVTGRALRSAARVFGVLCPCVATDLPVRLSAAVTNGLEDPSTVAGHSVWTKG